MKRPTRASIAWWVLLPASALAGGTVAALLAYGRPEWGPVGLGVFVAVALAWSFAQRTATARFDDLLITLAPRIAKRLPTPTIASYWDIAGISWLFGADPAVRANPRLYRAWSLAAALSVGPMVFIAGAALVWLALSAFGTG